MSEPEQTTPPRRPHGASAGPAVPAAKAATAGSDRRGGRTATRRRPSGVGQVTLYVAAAGAAAGVVYFAPAAPEPPRPVVELAAVERDTTPPPPPAPFWRHRVDTLARGETLAAVLERGGMNANTAESVLRSVGRRDARALRAGMAVTTRGLSTDSLPAEITFQPAVDRIIHLRYLEGAWKRVEEKLAWSTDTVGAYAVIGSSLYNAIHAAVGDRLPRTERSEVVYKLADLFEYRVDMSRELQPGDVVRVLLERKVAPDGSPRDAQILAASLRVSGKDLDAVRYSSKGVGSSYFDQDGKSLRAAFLRAPLNFRRISSVFGGRRHPVLGIWRMHKGTDYAASSGTAVRAIGDGVVVFAGWKGGYGRTLEVRHRNGYVTRYGHLRGFARGVRAGRSVGIGSTIGYVGSTGLASGPHLHFEVLVRGVQRDPRAALRDKSGFPIPTRERSAFLALRERLLASLDGAAPHAGREQTALGE